MSSSARPLRSLGGKIDLRPILRIAPAAPALPKPAGRVVRVAGAAQLLRAVEKLRPNTTILLAEGTYPLPAGLEVANVRGVSLRGESGRREKVVLDGAASRAAAAVTLWSADDFLLADLTCRNFRRFGLVLKAESGAQRTRVHNCVFHNIYVRGVKGTSPRQGGTGGIAYHADPHVLRARPAGGSIRYCLFHNDRVKWYEDGFGGDYVSGIDMMWLKDWLIADNVFVGIRGRHGHARGAIFVWNNSRNVLAERNLIVHCDRGIAFGNPSGARLHMTGGVARNNVIVCGARFAMEMCRTRETLVCHNSIYATQSRVPAVQFCQGARGGRFHNNLLHGRLECPKSMATGNNLIGDLSGYFVKPSVGDLHLTDAAAAAVGKARPMREVREDFDGRKRPPAPTLGALEP